MKTTDVLTYTEVPLYTPEQVSMLRRWVLWCIQHAKDVDARKAEARAQTRNKSKNSRRKRK